MDYPFRSSVTLLDMDIKQLNSITIPKLGKFLPLLPWFYTCTNVACPNEQLGFKLQIN